MQIDARGLKHPRPLQMLKEAITTMCSIEEYGDILVDNEQGAKQIKKFAKMSGCKYESHQHNGYLRVRIKGGTCMCG